MSGDGAPSDGLTDVAGSSTNLTDTADSELYANSANTSAVSASFPNTCFGSSDTTDLLSHTSTTTPSILPSTTSLAQPTFTNEQVERFQHRYEEGFDLFDQDYYHWLKAHHSDSVPTEIQTDSSNTLNSISLSNPVASEICCSSSSTSRLDLQTTPSIAELYSQVTPLQPVAIDIHSSYNSTPCLQSPK